MIKLGKDLKVGDVIKMVKVNGERGMTIELLEDYDGVYSNLYCNVALMYGITANGAHQSFELAIGTNTEYEVLNGEDE